MTGDKAVPRTETELGPGSVEFGQGFRFGENWRRFLKVVDEDRIREAERALRAMLEVETLAGKSFLDIGSGSGLSSLAARRLGASVVSFDFDSQSTACTAELRRRYFPEANDWRVEKGSVLDGEYLESLGQFDIVYSWGVLHHTGDMAAALENVHPLVAPAGRLFIAIYNDQGRRSLIWAVIKKIYNRLPAFLRPIYTVMITFPREFLKFLILCLMLRPEQYIETWTKYHRSRGMSRWYDIVDWIGGYPFEVAKPQEIINFYRERGFKLVRLKTIAGHNGNNEYVFEREPS